MFVVVFIPVHSRQHEGLPRAERPTRARAGLSRRPAAGVPAKRNIGGALGYVATWTAAMSVARMAGGTAFNAQANINNLRTIAVIDRDSGLVV